GRKWRRSWGPRGTAPAGWRRGRFVSSHPTGIGHSRVRPMHGTYDLVAIGSGPAGQRAVVQAAKLARPPAIVEREHVLGRLSTNTVTLPSKTLRAAVLELAGQGQRVYRTRQEVTIDDLLWRTQPVIEHEREVIRDQLRRNGVDVVLGTASFLDPHTLKVHASGTSRRL